MTLEPEYHQVGLATPGAATDGTEPASAGTESAGTESAGTGPDPDPTPRATPWQEYLAAAQSLDAVRREAATASAAAATGAGAATAAAAATAGPASVHSDLSRVRERLQQQRARLVGEAVRAGLPAPHLLPTAAEQAEARGRLAAPPDPVALAGALRHCHQLLDAADAHLVTEPAGAAAGPSPDPTAGAGPGTGPGAGPWVLPLAGPGAGHRPRPRSWPPLWLMVAVPLGAAAILVCAVSLLLVLTS